jgi:hypothetical protein
MCIPLHSRVLLRRHALHASAQPPQPPVLRRSRANQPTHSKTCPCTRTHDTHAYTHPAAEAAGVGIGQVDPSCTVPGKYCLN